MDLLANPIFFVGIASGFCTLFFGIWLGTRIGRSRERTSAQILCERIQVMAQQIARMASDVGSDVQTYNGRISDFQVQVNGIRNAREKRSSLLNDMTMAQAEDEVTVLLQAILQVNEGMKQRLDETEARLECHAQAMQSYITEARTDALTGLQNRRVLDQTIDQLYMDATRGSSREMSFVLLDVDNFKKFNDQHGHQAGDEVLKEVGRRLRETASGASVVARYGGEEFVAVLPYGLEKACKVAEEIRSSIESHPIAIDGKTLRITASLGVAFCELSEKPKGWVRRADSALYAAKGMGRNMVAYYHGGNCLPFRERVRGVPQTPVPQTPVPETPVVLKQNSPPPTAKNQESELQTGKVRAEAAFLVPTLADSQNNTPVVRSAFPVSQPKPAEPARSVEDALQAEVELLKVEAAKAKVQRRLDAIVREEHLRR